MDFGLSPEQRLLVDTLRRYLEEEAPWGRVRDIMRRDTAHDPLLWQGLAALGVPGVLVPAAYGGSGLALLDAVLIAETLAQGALPVPFLGSAVLAPLALLAAGTPAPQQAWLPQLASGRACIGVALAEQVGGREGAGMVLRDGRLFGKALFVLDAAAADAFLVATREGDLVLVPREAPGLRLTLLPTVDETRRLGELVCEAAPADCLGSRGEGEAVIARLLAAAWLVLAAEILGASERALDMAVAYAKERRQFGRPIGSFQAVKHLCAEMVAALEPARSLLWYAAYAFDAAPAEMAYLAPLVKAHLSEVGTMIAKAATEVHGGIGFTDEYPLQLLFKRITVNRQLLGNPAWLRRRAATAQGWLAPAAP